MDLNTKLDIELAVFRKVKGYRWYNFGIARETNSKAGVVFASIERELDIGKPASFGCIQLAANRPMNIMRRGIDTNPQIEGESATKCINSVGCATS